MRVPPLVLLLGTLSGPASAQVNPELAAAEAAFEALEYETVLQAARASLAGPPMGEPARARAWELIAFAYAALDSTEAAIAAFQQLVLVDPDRDYDPVELSPTIVSLHGLALGRELVVRHVGMDSVSFVAGAGVAEIRFQVTQPARVAVEVFGQGYRFPLADRDASGANVVAWAGLAPDSTLPPAGRYTIRIRATAFNNSYDGALDIRIGHGAVDTLPHVTSLSDVTPRPESERPRKNWIPLGLFALAAGAVSAGVTAMEAPAFDGSRRELLAIDGLALITGLYLSLRRHDPQPVEGNIAFNELLREQIATEVERIARDNEQRKRQVVLTIVPLPGENR